MKYENKSLWQMTAKGPNYPKLEKNIKTDVLIIGGGITGVSAFYHLAKSNLKVTLVEKNKIGFSVTSKTTGKLTYLQDNMYTKLYKYHGFNKTKDYLNSQIEAINIVKYIIEKEKINCDFEKVNSYIFIHNDSEKISKEIKTLKKMGVSIKKTNALPSKDKVKDAIYVKDTYVFHPLKYINSLLSVSRQIDKEVYENTKVLSVEKDIDKYICKTDNNIIKCKYLIIATHYPMFITPLWMPLKTYIEKSYIEALEVDKDYEYSAISIDKPIISVRYHKNKEKIFKLFLDSSHNAALKFNEKNNFDNLLKMNNTIPDYIWSNKDIMTNDKLPLVGALDEEKTVFIATGYNTWGMTNGSLAGKIISDLILQKSNDYSELFNPKRNLNLGKIINSPVVMSSNAVSFIKTKVCKNKPWYSKNVKFENRNGKNIAVYTDENSKEHIVYNLCPHLKCSLIFNEIEKTWDCPCHGSRFDIDGKCIEGPSNYDITYKE